jgi:hypothetical protein
MVTVVPRGEEWCDRCVAEREAVVGAPGLPQLDAQAALFTAPEPQAAPQAEPVPPTIDLDAIIAEVLTESDDTLMLTECCWGYDTFHDTLHVCRRCGGPNPRMIDVPRVEAEARWSEQEVVTA